MVAHQAGRCPPSAQHTAETLAQGHGAPDARGDAGGQSALRALLLLSGAVSPSDLALRRTSDADIAYATDSLALLGSSKPATHAA